MGTKTRSMGLSSLVVTTLDKGASSELLASGWTPSGDPPKLVALAYHGKDTALVPSCVSKAVDISANTVAQGSPEQMKPRVPTREVKTAVVLKASTTWRKSWNKRILSFDGRVIFLQKNENAKVAYKTASIGAVQQLARFSVIPNSSDSEGLEIVLEHETGARKDGDKWRLRFSSAAEALEWRMALATGALVDEVANGSPQAKNTLRLHHLISECGADVEYAVEKDLPLILFAVLCKRNDIVASLLRKGVDARALLRLNPRIRAILSIRALFSCLETTGRDLNLVGDDARGPYDEALASEDDVDGNWTLLHHLVAQRDVEATERLLQRIDRPTINLRTRSGETALSLALRKLSSKDTHADGQGQILALVRLLLAHGADPNLKTTGGDSALLLACKRSDELPLTIFQLLEDIPNLNVNALDRFGDAPIHILLKLHHSHLAKRLASDARTDLNIRDSSGIATLVLAMMLNEESFASFLLAKGADGSVPCIVTPTATSSSSAQRRFSTYPNCTTDTGGDETNIIAGNRPLHVAIRLHMTSLALKLIDRLPLEALTVRDSEGKSPLLCSILHSLLGVSHAIVTKLSQNGNSALLDDHDVRTGDTAMQLAIRAGRVELTNALLDAGADIAERNLVGETAIHVCARFVERTYNLSGGYTALKLFNRMIDCDAKRGAASCINVPTFAVDKVPSHQRVPALRVARTSRGEVGAQPVLHQAASCANEQCGLWLLDALFKSPVLSMDVLDGAGLTALACGIEAHNAEVCKLLLGKSNIRQSIAFGKETYLHLVLKHLGAQTAKSELLLPIVDMLLAHGAFAGVWDENGLTPLHLAASHKKYLPALSVLLKDRDVLAHRLDDRTEFSGLTPLMIAIRESKSPEIVELFLEAGADVRLLEPRTRKGVFQMCLEDNFESQHTDNLAICVKLVQLVPETVLLSQGDEEWRARKVLAERHAALIAAAQELDHSREDKVPERRLSQPLLMCNDRLMNESTKLLMFAASSGSSPTAAASTPGQKRSGPSGRGTENVAGNSSQAEPEPKRPPRVLSKQELDQKLEVQDDESVTKTEGGTAGDTTDSENDDEPRSSDDSASEPARRRGAYGSRLSQLDRVLAMERIRAEALETANAWLETDSGKKMISQIATVLIHETDESITQEAAIALATRNFIEEHVKAGLQQFEKPSRVPLPTHESSQVISEDSSLVAGGE